MSMTYTVNGNAYTFPDMFTGYGYVTAFPALIGDFITQAASTLSAASGSSTLAQNWASQLGGKVAGTDWSAKEYAVGTDIRGIAGGGSAKDWATYTGGPVDGTSYSAQYIAQAAAASATSAASSASNAASSAVTVQNFLATMSGTSTTSLTIATGSVTLTTGTNLNFVVGQFVTIANTGTPANYLHGQVTAYNAGTGALTVTVGDTGGSGTFAAWTVSVSGSRGTIGATGGLNGPSTTIVGYMPTWANTTGTLLGAGIPVMSVATMCLYFGPNMPATAYNYSTSFGDTNSLANAQCTIFGAGNSTGTSGGNAIFGNQSSVSSLGCLAVGSQNTVASPFGTAVGYNHNLSGTGPTLAFGVACTSTANSHSLLMGYAASTSVGNSIVIGRGAVNYTYSCAIGQNTGGARPWSGSSLSFSTTSPWNSSGPSSGQYAQSARILMTQQTSTATATELFTDGASGRMNVFNPPTNALLTCHGFVTAQSGTNCAVWEVKAAIQRAANGNVALVGTPTVTSLFTSGTVTGWAVALSADTTNQTLKFAVTGSATQTLNWLARLEATELAM